MTEKKGPYRTVNLASGDEAEVVTEPKCRCGCAAGCEACDASDFCQALPHSGAHGNCAACSTALGFVTLCREVER